LNIDAFDSCAQLGLCSDSRFYMLAASGLTELGLPSVRLLTNNPDKVSALAAADINVFVVPLHTSSRSERAREYLDAKRSRRGHFIPIAAQVVVRVGRAQLVLVLVRRSRWLSLPR
jgi:3,4-dihydroxy 2-butanone 4-phosphate synthase/GTP cyclohydrolase II